MAQKKTILFIDDNPVDRTLISKILEKYEFEVLVAEDGPGGLRVAQERKLDIILMDILLPGISGIELCKKFKKNAATQDIPVIFYSSIDTPKELIDYTSYGARDYIQKTTPPDELIASIRFSILMLDNKDELFYSVLGKEEILPADDIPPHFQLKKQGMKEAILYLQDGTSFHGRTLKETGETSGEAVFNTAMTGYQEILTDPSYTGQIVVMTYPLIGNYGTNDQDVESDRIHVKGFVVKEFCRRPSNWRSKKSLIDYLNENKIIAIEGVDTRALTRHLRMVGAMKAIISTEDFDPISLQKKLDEMPSMEGMDFVKDVSTLKKYVWKPQGPRRYKIAAIDCGIKLNILRILAV